MLSAKATANLGLLAHEKENGSQIEVLMRYGITYRKIRIIGIEPKVGKIVAVCCNGSGASGLLYIYAEDIDSIFVPDKKICIA